MNLGNIIKAIASLFKFLHANSYIRISGLYLPASLALMHYIEIVASALHLPEFIETTIVILCLIGLPITLLMVWACTHKKAIVNGEEKNEYNHKRIAVCGVISLIVLVATFMVYEITDWEFPQAKRKIKIGIASEFSAVIKHHFDLYFIGKEEFEPEYVVKGPTQYEEARKEFKEDEFDIIMIDDPWVTNYDMSLQDMRKIKGFNHKKFELLKNDFYFPLLDVCLTGEKKEKLIGLPVTGNVHLMLYRKDIIKDVPPMDSYPELPISINPMVNGILYNKEVLLKRNIEPVAIQYDIGNSITEIFWELLRIQKYQDSVVNDVVFINKKYAQNALIWLYFAKNQPDLDHPLDIPELVDKISSGKVACAFGWPNWVFSPGLKDTNQVGLCKVSDHPVLGAWIFCIPKSSHHKKAALKIIMDFVTNETYQKNLASYGVVPVLSRFNCSSLKDVPFWCENFCTVQKAIVTSVPRPRVKKWAEVEDEIGRQVQIGLTEPDKFQFQNKAGLIQFY